jgi:uncharacterized repeat protein (TIGR02543 family)
MPAIKAYLNNNEDEGWSDNDAAWWGASGYHVKNYRFNADISTSAGYYPMWELNYIFVTGDYSGGNYNYNVPPAQYFYNGVVLTNKAGTTILQNVQAKQRVAPGSSIDLWTTDDKLWHFYFDIVRVPIIYTATFVYNDGSANATATYTFNTYNTFPTPTRTGYTFSGWTSNPNIGTGTSLTWTHAGNITFNAQWTAKSYTATFIYGNGDANTTYNYTFNTYNTFPTPTRTGYTFSGWTSNPNIGTGTSFTWTNAGNITFTGQWTVNSYTLTIINNNGAANTTATYNYNSRITVYAGTKPGYRFVKFTSNFGDISNGGNFTWNRASDETLTSVWEIIRYTVTFEKSIIDPPRTSSIITPSYITQDNNTAVTFPTFKAIGYTFVRWKDANNNTYTTINKLTGDITLYAEWQKKETINFSELNRVYNGTRGGNPPNRGVNSISIGKFRAESGQTGTNKIKLITHFQGKGL